MRLEERLARILIADSARWLALAHVRTLALPNAWIGAGFVRDAVWDHLHGRAVGTPCSDVDVIWFDATTASADIDRDLERTLTEAAGSYQWSVKNQARMHFRNGDAPYRSTKDAMRYWPETATAVAVRRRLDDGCDVIAPFGLNDLFELRLVPTPIFAGERQVVFNERVASKRWLERYPRLSRLKSQAEPSTSPADSQSGSAASPSASILRSSTISPTSG